MGPPLVAVSVARRERSTSVATGGRTEAWRPSAPRRPGARRELAAWLADAPEARVLGPALHESQVPGLRESLLDADIAPSRILAEPAIPSAWAVARLTRIPAAFDAQALFALEPHYVRASEAERNPKFPPLPGPAPGARLRGEEENS